MENPVLYCDGLTEPNPGGPMCWGWVLIDSGTGAILLEGQGCESERGSTATNNRAEYAGVLAGLRGVWAAGYRVLTVRSDSQLVVNQVTGLWTCSAEGLQPLLARVQHAALLMTLTWEWIPREQNAAADTRSRAAYYARMGFYPPVRPPKARRPDPGAAPTWKGASH